MTKTDLSTRTEIHDLVVDFYREIANDEDLGYVFADVAEVDWTLHIPKLIDYWCRVLLGQPGYDGYILRAHEHVHGLEPIPFELFNRWYVMWVESIDSAWEGPIAEKAKSHGAKTMKMLAKRLRGEQWSAPSETRLAELV